MRSAAVGVVAVARSTIGDGCPANETYTSTCLTAFAHS